MVEWLLRLVEDRAAESAGDGGIGSGGFAPAADSLAASARGRPRNRMRSVVMGDGVGLGEEGGEGKGEEVGW